MSRVAKKPIDLPPGVEVKLNGNQITVNGPKGSFDYSIHELVVPCLENDGKTVTFKAANDSKQAVALAGTSRALVNNFVTGVSQGFEKKLQLVGVGYRAQKKDNVIHLTLGYSHPVEYTLPEGMDAEIPDNTTIILKGIDKQRVGQVAAEIRAKRPPEPYKGKGVRYADEHIIRKETKKK